MSGLHVPGAAQGGCSELNRETSATNEGMHIIPLVNTMQIPLVDAAFRETVIHATLGLVPGSPRRGHVPN